ncbi:DUF6142 family protein [[Clostridium] polysaccharolyticum]|uniref:Uncharacterized protein n=1 Tax=[Clostridium] polysaccharolyticum TaxID=29364 RepID=A0A1H9ZED0_9FIRM|nr:DUF6142 family protein [[Clostridium] polysaccharolyticum]SES79943.1 hypothetical protein SAMN04487772_103162 [[Clostridium] polysaccharolyticum]
MMQIGKRREAYTFSDKAHPKEGIFASILGGVLLIAFLVLFAVTSKKQGGLGVGLAGLLILFCSIAGIVLSIRAMKKEDILYRYPVIGLAVNGIVLLISIALYFAGLASDISI